MLEETLKVANSLGMWFCALITVALVLVQSVLYLRLAIKESKRINFPMVKVKRSFRIGATTAIGPAIAVCVVLIGMMASLGAPISWMRLSIIGAAATELTASTVAAESIGTTLGAPDFSLQALSLAGFTMAINVTGWLIVCVLFTHKADDIQHKLGGGDKKWMALITAGASTGVFANLAAQRCVAGTPSLIACFASVATMFIFIKFLNPKVKGLAEWNLGICMIVSMVVGTLCAQVMG